MRRKGNATYFAGIILILAFQEVSEGAEWSVSPAILLATDYDDNVLLTTQPHSSVTSTTISPRLNFGISSAIWQLGGGAQLISRRFSGNDQKDIDAQSFNIASSYRTERSVWQLNAFSSKTSYLADTAISPNIGLFQEDRVSDARSLSLSWTWSMTELTQLQLAYSQSDVSYVNGQSIGLFDSRSSAVSVRLSNELNVSTQIFLLSTYSIFRVPATTFEAKAASSQLGISRKFSSTLTGTFSAGLRNTLSEQEGLVCTLLNPFYPSLGPPCLQTAKETSFSRDSSTIFNANLTKQFETVSLTAAVSRSFDLTAIGQQVRADSASLALRRPLTPKLTANFSVSAYNTVSETDIAGGTDHRKLYQIQPSLQWQWDPEWNLDISYRYSDFQRIGESQDIASNAVYLTLAYQPTRISISR